MDKFRKYCKHTEEIGQDRLAARAKCN
jgi:hypothetical protein